MSFPDCRRRFTAISFAIALFSCLLPAGYGTEPRNLVDDGWFSGSGISAQNQILRKGQRLSTWQVTSGNVGLHVTEFRPPITGANSIDLNGSSSGAIGQTLQVRQGLAYTVRFLMSGNWTKNADAPRALRVQVGDLQRDITLKKPAGWSGSSMQWAEQRFDFTAKSSQVQLQLISLSTSTGDAGPVVCQVTVTEQPAAPAALDTVAIPRPSQLHEFIRDREKAIALGKALFWDQQAGSDGRTACATCHWHAGADLRLRNTLHPGPVHTASQARPSSTNSTAPQALPKFQGPNQTVRATDYPFHRIRNPLQPADEQGQNPVLSDTPQVTGSQGVVSRSFVQILPGRVNDTGRSTPHPIFQLDGSQTRQVTSRNSPSVINAVYMDRLFWDGRANYYFNGVNAFGDLDRHARVLKRNPSGKVESVAILLDNAALASQAVAPVLSRVESSWDRRTFSDLGRKMLSLRPLSQQRVAADDSVLGKYRHSSGRGLDNVTAGYSALIREAFRPEWWSGTTVTPFGYTQMEENFSLFWGLSIMLYESTLISDQTPYDRFARGDSAALSPMAKRGLDLFLKEGRCIECHGGPEFAGATISHLRRQHERQGLIETMQGGRGTVLYDSGFYNIGVRPTQEDLGLGHNHPKYGPLSYVVQERLGRNPDPKISVSYAQPVSINGAFRSPSLRNVELTGPYMHNGGMKSLEEVLQFYARGGDFSRRNSADLAPDIHPLPALQNDPDSIRALAEFLKHLTDPRVRLQQAPFDHPELLLPHGHSQLLRPDALDDFLVLPANGRHGGTRLQTFEEALEHGLNLSMQSGGVM